MRVLRPSVGCVSTVAATAEAKPDTPFTTSVLRPSCPGGHDASLSVTRSKLNLKGQI